MKNKGFTLIELLAVIVILAIIALIATPVILGIIDDARTSAKEESAKLVVSSTKLAYSTAFMTSGTTSAGIVPQLSEIKTALDRDLDNATTTVTGNVLTVVTTDGVTCTFTATSDTLSGDDCGGILKDSVGEIGKITPASS